jgi:hypothetical protein
MLWKEGVDRADARGRCRMSERDGKRRGGLTLWREKKGLGIKER